MKKMREQGANLREMQDVGLDWCSIPARLDMDGVDTLVAIYISLLLRVYRGTVH
jgi:hypothetical protein